MAFTTSIETSQSSCYPNQTECSSSLNPTAAQEADYLWRENNKFATTLIPAMTFVGLLMLCGCVGNLLVVYVFGFRFKPATQNSLFVCLACFDLLMSAVAMPSEIADMRFHHTFSSVMACKLLRFITMFSSISSCFVLLVIAADRHRRVTQPLRRQMTVTRARIWETLSVFGALLLSWPTMVLSGLRSSETAIPGIKGTDCSFSDEFKNSKFPLAHNTVLGIGFFVVTTVLAVFYFRIWRVARAHVLKNLSRSNTSHSGASSGEPRVAGISIAQEASNINETRTSELTTVYKNMANVQPCLSCSNSAIDINLKQISSCTDNPTETSTDGVIILRPTNLVNTPDLIKEIRPELKDYAECHVHDEFKIVLNNFPTVPKDEENEKNTNGIVNCVCPFVASLNPASRESVSNLNNFRRAKYSGANISLQSQISPVTSTYHQSFRSQKRDNLLRTHLHYDSLDFQSFLRQKSLYSSDGNIPDLYTYHAGECTVMECNLYTILGQPIRRSKSDSQLTQINHQKKHSKVSQHTFLLNRNKSDTKHSSASSTGMIVVNLGLSIDLDLSLDVIDNLDSLSITSTRLDDEDKDDFQSYVDLLNNTGIENTGDKCDNMKLESICGYIPSGKTENPDSDSLKSINIEPIFKKNTEALTPARDSKHQSYFECENDVYVKKFKNDGSCIHSRITCPIFRPTSGKIVELKSSCPLTAACVSAASQDIASINPCVSVEPNNTESGDTGRIQNSAESQQRHKPSLSTEASRSCFKAPTRRTIRYIDKATVVAFTISLVFILSFLPYLALMFTRALIKNFDYHLEGSALCAYNIFLRFYLLNSALNPLLYGVLNDKFRQECKTLLCKPWSFFKR